MGFVRSTSVHNCPGQCGALVPNRLYACREDWHRLPSEFQALIWSTAKMALLAPERRLALTYARQWYRDNPREAATS